MPLYEYHCNACGADLEILHGVSEAPPKKCPECGKLKLVKHVSAAGFRLGGAGWYETDFKSDKDKKKNLVGDKAEAAPACAPGGCEKPGCAAAAESQAAKPASSAKSGAKAAAKPAAKASKPAKPAKKNKAA
ncbi:putative regulatory protein, FmdB family [Solimonas aquatica]|uniref:Putative regulatory protein, FmdB family n=1 Tax=Solimonas aquatica TaxID=489703 RepID=A0A1H9DE55_9GAMM|nr:zinc ribbon domain-containing protein [Solimonas aquatica]SEQ11740.1 putative regulatory protein, FmdB family [Solimonas aquatica]